MFKNLFSTTPKLSPAAKFCFDLVSRNRFEASRGSKDIPRFLPVVYATHPAFIGSIIAIIDFAKKIISDPTPHSDVIRQVMEALFGDNANKAAVTAADGFDDPALMNEFEKISAHLEWAAKLPGNRTEQELKFLVKYF